MKLDAKAYGTVRKVKDDSIISEDEWVLFQVRDNAFAEILPLYRDVCVRLGCDSEHIAAVGRLIDRVNTWRLHHHDKCKIPGAHGEKLLDQDQST